MSIPPVDFYWWGTLSPAEQLEHLSSQELSALLAERVFGWRVWRSEHTGAWLALEHERQNPQTPSAVLDWASHNQNCMEMLNKRVFGKVDCILTHRLPKEGQEGDGFRFFWSPDGKQIYADPWFPTWPRAAVRTMLVGHTDNLQDSCLGYLFDPENWHRRTRAGNP